MTRRTFRSVFDAIIMLVCLSPVLSIAQDKDTASYPDLNISKSIITELMERVYGTYDRIDVYANYLPDRGLLFVVNPPYKGHLFEDFSGPVTISKSILDSTLARTLDSTFARFDSSMSKLNSIQMWMGTRPKPRPYYKKKSEPEKDYSEGQYNAVMNFLENYADAENKLSPAQEITVVILSEGETPARIFEVSKKEVSDYRSSLTGEAQLKKSVQIAELKEKGEHDSIDIMSTILDKSFTFEFPMKNFVLPGQNTNGLYLKDLGALFVCRVTNMPSTDMFEMGEESRKVDVEKINKEVIRILGDYGSSLRFLKNDESIFVLLALDPYSPGGENILIRLKKSDVDQYSKNEMSFDALQQRATVIENQ